MAATASDILDIARGELETKEYPPGSNNVKYNTDYYGREVSGSGFAWCAVFVWWVFRQAGVSGLYGGGQKFAYVPALLSWAKKDGLIVDTPQPGDLVCFDFNANGVADHIGICESFDGKYVTTIDGNTGTTNDANGGAVLRRRRDKKYIVGVIRPDYEKEGKIMDFINLTDQQVQDLIARMNAVMSKQEPSAWSEQARQWAEENGIIAGDEKGNKQYKKPCTREELVQILYNKEVG